MDVVWLNQFKLNRFETGLSASVNGAYDHVMKNVCIPERGSLGMRLHMMKKLCITNATAYPNILD